MATPTPLLTTAELARWLRVSPRCLFEMRAAGKLPFVRVGRAIRFDAAEVARALKIPQAIGGESVQSERE